MSTIVVDPYLAELAKLGRTRDTSNHPPGERGEGLKSSMILVIMSAISLAVAVGEALIPAAGLHTVGLEIGSIGRSLAGPSATALLGIGLTTWFISRRADASERRYMLLAPFLALAVGTMIAGLVHVAGYTSSLGWLVSPVYLLWAWGWATSER